MSEDGPPTAGAGERTGDAVRVVVAEDHPMFRFGLVAALSGYGGIDVVGEAADGRELLALVEQTSPDVVLTDLTMPHLDGIAAIRHLKASPGGPAVLVLTMHDDDQTLVAALRAGADGYLFKGADRTEIAHAVLAAASGSAVYGRDVAAKIRGFFTQAQHDHTAQAFPELTAREREVLGRVALGQDNHQIARSLCVAEKTVRNHVSTIMSKIGTTTRAETVARARDAGLGS
ncbi:response regulator transcription factor [Streptomyces sp. NPDC001941]|uniref:response regulator transcription factor n=1 Tax=Streptomyces sp. NPDC001941 TaxID=3154659 RepID=UPI00331CDBDC